MIVEKQLRRPEQNLSTCTHMFATQNPYVLMYSYALATSLNLILCDIGTEPHTEAETQRRKLSYDIEGKRERELEKRGSSEER